MKSLFFALMAFAVSCSQGPLGKKTEGIKLTILHTNDHHGRFWSNKDGEYGLAARATLIAQIREEVKKNGGDVLLLDAGDVNTGVPQSDLLNAEPDFRGMSALGYDAMALGNHEFDNPLKVLFKQQKDWANFPFISANIYDKKKGRLFPSHVTKKVNGLNVTIFGLTTEDTPKKSNPDNSKGLYFRPAVEEAKAIVPVLRPNSDVLIALTHTGHYPDEKNGADAPGDVTIARQAKGIDIIVGGHTQKPLFKPDIQNGAIIVQAYEWGKYVGRIDLEVINKKVILKDYKLIPVNLKEDKTKILPDQKMEAMLRPFKEKGDKSLSQKIGFVDEELMGRRDVVRTKETNLGNLITRAYKDKFGADFAITNSGGIRDSIYPGDITIETILMVLPFGGEIVTAELTGKELKNYLEAITSTLLPGSGSFPQMSGATIILDKATKKIKSLKINGKEIEEKRSYLIALPDFIAKGGDNYPVINFRKYGYVDADVLKAYILKKKKLQAKAFEVTQYIKFE